MPNALAQPNHRAEGTVFRTAPAFAQFEGDPLKDLIPSVEQTHPVKAERERRALAGRPLNFELGNLDTFAWAGGSSSAPDT